MGSSRPPSPAYLSTPSRTLSPSSYNPAPWALPLHIPAGQPPEYAFSSGKLQWETEQCQRDIQNFPFLSSSKKSALILFPLREVPLGGGDIGFVNAHLTSSEVRNLRRELKPLLDDPFGVADQIGQFMESQPYTWAESMSVLGILFSGKERTMICRATMIVQEREHPPVQNVLAAKHKFPAQDPQRDNNNEAH